MSSYFRQQLESWLKTIDVKADRVLDVGGAQLPVKGRTKSWEVGDYKILDLENPHKCETKPDYIADLQERSDWQSRLDIKDFDIIFCLEVMEYIYDPLFVLQELYFTLKKGGTLYISFPFIYPIHAPEGEDCLRYTRFGVEKLLKKTGFEIEYIKPRIEFNAHQMNKDYFGIESWFRNQKMHPLKDYPRHNEIGYLVKAIKK